MARLRLSKTFVQVFQGLFFQHTFQLSLCFLLLLFPLYHQEINDCLFIIVACPLLCVSLYPLIVIFAIQGMGFFHLRIHTSVISNFFLNYSSYFESYITQGLYNYLGFFFWHPKTKNDLLHETFLLHVSIRLTACCAAQDRVFHCTAQCVFYK